MKIGIDCRLWDETGVGRYIRNLILNLQKLDQENEYALFVLSKDCNQVISHLSSLNFHLVKADVRWHTLEEQLKLPQILNRENLDLVHFPYFSVPIFYNRPFVVTIHDLIIHHFPTGQASTLPFPIYSLKLLGYKFVMNQVARKAKKIIVPLICVKEDLVNTLKVSGDKIVVTYEGVNLNGKLKMNPSASSGEKSQFKIKNYFLYVGNAYPHKNLERLLQAFSILISKYPSVSLVMVGKEDYFYKRLKDKVRKLGLVKNVSFLKHVNDKELSDLYRSAKALISPSLMEGFGLPALEAMANKCLVLASDIPALKETCGDAALYFNPLSIDELAGKLRIVTSHTTEYGGLEELKKRGVERARKFSWRKMAKETLKVYESCFSL